MTNQTDNPDSITNEDIHALRVEAGAHGDIETAKVCLAALYGSGSARTRCATWIKAARAMCTGS